MSKDGSLLHILSGYSDFPEDGGALHSAESVGLQTHGTEHDLEVEGTRFASCFAAAVSLSSGDLVLTGGQGHGRDVFLISEHGRTWVRLSIMIHARYGHAASRVTVGQEEYVMVAGGWTSQAQAQDTVELYSTDRDQWQHLDSLPSPRVHFTLQVG